MIGIVGIVALLTVLALSLIITRLATAALVLTGLSEEAARFQARSAFTGTGFTTREAEQVVNHPVRRRIVMVLMILRSAGLLTIVISLILSFAQPAGQAERLYRLLWLIGGVMVLWAMAQSHWIDRGMQWIIARALQRWTDLDVRDYAGLLRLSGDYSVMKVQLEEGDWLEGRKVRDCLLADEGVTILGIYRDDGSYVGVPNGETELYAGDALVVYGRSDVLRELDRRRQGRSGDRAHAEAVNEQQGRMRAQEAREEASRKERELRRKHHRAEHKARDEASAEERET